MNRPEMIKKVARLWLENVAADEIGAALDPLNSENEMSCSVCGKTSNESDGDFAASTTADCEWPACNECIARIVDGAVEDIFRRTPPAERK